MIIKFAHGAAVCASAVLISFAAQAADNKAMSGMQMSGPAKTPASDAAMIASAMAAGPASIAKSATIMAPGSGGKMRTLRQGTNGYTCFPDDAIVPGPNSMCADKNATEWLNAYMAKKQPPQGRVGFIYMLAGGTDASNTDPLASKPVAGTHWVKTGPHVMVVGADAAFYASYPSGADPDTSVPYVMFAGTPYQHLMAPVK